jgi:hypothetical protein
MDTPRVKPDALDLAISSPGHIQHHEEQVNIRFPSWRVDIECPALDVLRILRATHLSIPRLGAIARANPQWHPARRFPYELKLIGQRHRP